MKQMIPKNYRLGLSFLDKERDSLGSCKLFHIFSWQPWEIEGKQFPASTHWAPWYRALPRPPQLPL